MREEVFSGHANRLVKNARRLTISLVHAINSEFEVELVQGAMFAEFSY